MLQMPAHVRDSLQYPIGGRRLGSVVDGIVYAVQQHPVRDASHVLSFTEIDVMFSDHSPEGELQVMVSPRIVRSEAYGYYDFYAISHTLAIQGWRLIEFGRYIAGERTTLVFAVTDRDAVSSYLLRVEFLDIVDVAVGGATSPSLSRLVAGGACEVKYNYDLKPHVSIYALFNEYREKEYRNTNNTKGVPISIEAARNFYESPAAAPQSRREREIDL